MSLRPRYSLLTLLVVTALVAGGVKLWYGPHLVVERTCPEMEEEYTYTRDWRGTKIIDGLWLRRVFNNETLVAISVMYYRKGDPRPWRYLSYLVPADPQKLKIRAVLLGGPSTISPTPVEEAVCQELIEREWQDLRKHVNLYPHMEILSGLADP